MEYGNIIWGPILYLIIYDKAVEHQCTKESNKTGAVRTLKDCFYGERLEALTLPSLLY